MSSHRRSDDRRAGVYSDVRSIARRGVEVILQGRGPRDAWAFCERICGVCTTVHALTSVRCVENALGIQVPKDADIIRNIMFLTQMVQDHVVHFYWRAKAISATSPEPSRNSSTPDNSAFSKVRIGDIPLIGCRRKRT